MLAWILLTVNGLYNDYKTLFTFIELKLHPEGGLAVNVTLEPCETVCVPKGLITQPVVEDVTV